MVYAYDYPQLANFKVDIYTNVFEDCVKKLRPSVILVGATSTGRSLAPSVATRFKTGLTADCTALEMRENSDLVQIRPAFGGNIMAQIITTNNRPQMATVRYKVMNSAHTVKNYNGRVIKCQINSEKLNSKIKILNIYKTDTGTSITDADLLVVAGKGIRDVKDMGMIYKLAAALGGKVALTRPLVEAGYGDYTQQIGLSGRTVKPKVIITCGVSGSVQFAAGMNSSDCIIAINSDPKAPIFNIAHYSVVGDIYRIIPQLTAKVKGVQVDEL